MREKMKINVTLWTLVLPCVFVLSTPGFAEEKTANSTEKKAEDSKEKQATKGQPTKEQPTKEQLFSAASISKLSETYGHLIQKGLDNPVLKLDMDAVIKGMHDGRAGKPSPMTEQEYEESINKLQEYAYQDLASRNLQEAEKFLKENGKKKDVKEIEPNKLQYLILKEGSGVVVSEDVRPMIKYSGQYLDGTVFGASDAASGAVAISLKQTIPGFRRAILGMKVGEKRRIFIHPELGYGTSGQLLPNALLIFDIEVTEVQPEPKETSKLDDCDADSMQIGAENLFSDELDERDDFDDDDDQDDDGDEEELKRAEKAIQSQKKTQSASEPSSLKSSVAMAETSQQKDELDSTPKPVQQKTGQGTPAKPVQQKVDSSAAPQPVQQKTGQGTAAKPVQQTGDRSSAPKPVQQTADKDSAAKPVQRKVEPTHNRMS